MKKINNQRRDKYERADVEIRRIKEKKEEERE